MTFDAKPLCTFHNAYFYSSPVYKREGGRDSNFNNIVLLRNLTLVCPPVNKEGNKAMGLIIRMKFG